MNDRSRVEPAASALEYPPPFSKDVTPNRSANGAYDTWLAQQFPRAADLQRMADTWPFLGYQPLISIVMPVFNPPVLYLQRAIESVLQQVYPHWELCIADDVSADPQIRSILEDYAARDSRIKVVFRSENGHISRCSNSALELATGEFMALLDHDDLLTPDALYENVLLLNRHPDADMIYSDEDKVDDQNLLKEPYFKPDWSPDAFLSRMYTCHLGVYRRSIVTQIGGFRIAFEGSQDYDLVLRFTEQTDRIFHIPKILYHWRIHLESAASGGEAKPYAFIAAENALNEALVRRGEAGKIEGVGGFLGAYIARYQLLDRPRVSIILASEVESSSGLDACLSSIFGKSKYENFEVILVGAKEDFYKPYPEQEQENWSVESGRSIGECVNQWLNQEPDRFRFYSLEAPFSYAKFNNYGVRQATGDYVVFLNASVEITTADWLEAMLEQAQRQTIGAVGGLLIDTNETIRHAGIIAGLKGVADSTHKQLPATTFGYFGQIISINNYSAISGDCLMCRRARFEQIGSFTESLSAYADIDLCFKLGKAGFRHVYLPHVLLRYGGSDHSSAHAASDSQPSHRSQAATEMQKRWRSWLDRDPYYNPNLPLDRYDHGIQFLVAAPEPSANDATEAIALQLRDTQEQLQRMREKFHDMRANVKQLRAKLQQTEAELQDTQETIMAMETSKFWRLRKRWIRLKQAVRINRD